MLKQTLMAASIALLLAGPASADNGKKPMTMAPYRKPIPANPAPAKADAAHRDDRRDDDRDHDRGRGRDWNRGRDHDRDRGDDRRDWRSHDGRDDDWRGRNWRDDDWRGRGGWHDGWRRDYWRDDRHWRHYPPPSYRLDFGYRSGYELAWRDWLSYGRYDRYWRRSSFYGFGVGYTYHSGYEAGWRDAAFYYGRGYRPDYWAYDPRGGWYFSFHITG